MRSNADDLKHAYCDDVTNVSHCDPLYQLPYTVSHRSEGLMPPSKLSEFPGGSEVRTLSSEESALNTRFGLSLRSEFGAEVKLPESPEIRRRRGESLSSGRTDVFSDRLKLSYLRVQQCGA
ncbi:unnamed protein product [Boreogadus saida]